MLLFGKKRKARKAMLEVYEKLMNYIMNWNARTFPDATLEGQINKLNEEMLEFKKAGTRDEKWQEVADIFIVLGGLRRWNYKEGAKLEKDFLKGTKNEALKDVLDCIFDKMIINLDRKWQKQGTGNITTPTPQRRNKKGRGKGGGDAPFLFVVDF